MIQLKVLPAFATSSSAFPLCPSSWTASAREGRPPSLSPNWIRTSEIVNLTAKLDWLREGVDDLDDGDDGDDGVDGVNGNCLGRCVCYIQPRRNKQIPRAHNQSGNKVCVLAQYLLVGMIIIAIFVAIFIFQVHHLHTHHHPSS